MEKFVIRKTIDGEFQFDFMDTNGSVILKSGNYTKKPMCLNGIESVKDNSQDGSKFKLKRSLNNELYFNLKSFNGRIIGTSQMFDNKTLRDGAIEFIKTKAPNAPIEDQSR